MGDMFGSYEIIRKLAAGGMAEVMLCKQHGMGDVARVVCLKRVLPHLIENEDFIKMFQDEARIVSNLIHPNIAQIYDVGTYGSEHYIAMEYVQGEDVRKIYNQEVRRESTMPFTVAAHIMAGVLAGLDYAHRQTGPDGRPLGIVHRDVTPQNILVTYDGYVKIIDFGVAKAAGKIMQTRSGVLKGKYSYMAPEQASGEKVDARADIFAAGIVLYEITTGTRLFKREGEVETLQAAIACKIPPPSDIIRGYDRDLEKILLKALQRDVSKRYQTAGEFEDALLLYLRKHHYTPTSAVLGTYMQDLFADVLADQKLHGADEEPNTRVQVRPVVASDVAHRPVSQGSVTATTVLAADSSTHAAYSSMHDPWESFSETRAGGWDAHSVVEQAPLFPEVSLSVKKPPSLGPAASAAHTSPPESLSTPAAFEPSDSGLRMRVPSEDDDPVLRSSIGAYAGFFCVVVCVVLGAWWWKNQPTQTVDSSTQASMPYIVFDAQEPARWNVLSNTWAWAQWEDGVGVEAPFQRYMPAGLYTVHFECPGGVRSTQQVRLQADQETVTFVHCEPWNE